MTKNKCFGDLKFGHWLNIGKDQYALTTFPSM
jgi:hypothetical protein